MFSRFLAAQRAAHHNQTVGNVLPIRRQCLSSSPSSESSSPWLAWYSKCLETHPLTTKGITSGCIASAGDFICQYLSSESTIGDQEAIHPTSTALTFSWDAWRTARFFLMGAAWVAPVTHVWYEALSTRLIPGGRSRTKVLQRLLLDQFGFAPLFVPSFMAGLWWLEGRTDVAHQLWEVAPGVIEANWTLWIPAQLFNFAVVPLNYQVLFGNIVALVWNVYVSWVVAATTDTDPSSSADGPLGPSATQ